MSILAVVNDLFFQSKIGHTAETLNLVVHFVKNADELFTKARQQQPPLIIIDLNSAPSPPVETIALLKSDPDLARTTVLGFFSHVQTDLKERAIQAGCDIVLPRSAFSKHLSELLAKHGQQSDIPHAPES